MLVKELKKALMKFPDDMEVLYDATPSTSKQFVFLSVDEADIITTSVTGAEEFVLLACGTETPRPNTFG